ncbi:MULTISPECIES: phospholipase D family protein [Pseudomonas]|uniref:phospholipase D family protein n=1 Tax=Pseudomonas TaxID=286 RepID=UPI000DA8136F|nr:MULTISPECIES: phospholipase D family protein [Pseudomonas]MDW3714877.1 phospholipase D family protein [Pseudomonas sp. 2023EL-01195]PZE11335.1 phospholipase D family protein [Pseudomonas sp. 57B-090624]
MRISLLFICLLATLAGCVTPPPASPSQAIAAAESPFGRRLLALAATHPGQSGFRLLPASNEAYSARAELIRSARSSLDLQYYIVHDGLSTRALFDELLRAADRGVRVRLLLDDTSSDGRDASIALLTAHPNIQVRLFNPLHLGRATGATRTLGRALDLGQQHRRMHNKLWLADNAAAIVGGRNLGDEYFDAEPSLNFTDIDLLAIGPVAEQLGQSFDQYWNSALSKPIQQFLWRQPERQELDEARQRLRGYLAQARARQKTLYDRLHTYRDDPRLDLWLRELIWAPASALWDAPSKVLASGPPDPQLLLASQLQPVLDEVKEDLVLVSAYFVPAPEGMDYLIGKADGGVDIRLLTNALEATDVPAVHGGYAPYRQRLLEHGVHLFELRRQPGDGAGSGEYSFSGSSNSSLHSKAMILDRRRAFIGSFNFDPRSVLWNTEVGVLIDSPELSAHLHRLALQGMSPGRSYQVRLGPGGEMLWITGEGERRQELRREPGSLWRRFNAWFAERVGLERML